MIDAKLYLHLGTCSSPPHDGPQSAIYKKLVPVGATL